MIANLRQSNDAFFRYRSNGPFGMSGNRILSLIAAKEIAFGVLKTKSYLLKEKYRQKCSNNKLLPGIINIGSHFSFGICYNRSD